MCVCKYSVPKHKIDRMKMYFLINDTYVVPPQFSLSPGGGAAGGGFRRGFRTVVSWYFDPV